MQGFEWRVPTDRRTMLAAVVAGLIPAFVITHVVVARFEHHRQDLASEWTATANTTRGAIPTLLSHD